MENLQKFIKDYFSLLNLKKMPDTVKEHYDKMVSNKDFPNKTVKGWADKMTNGNWNNLPDFKTLKDDELNELYVDLLETLDAMSAHTTNMDDDTKKFISAYFGDGKLFNVPPIAGGTKSQMERLITLVLNDTDVKAMDLLYGQYNGESILRAVLSGRKKYEDKDVKELIHTIISNYRQLKRENYLSERAAAKLDSFNWDTMQDAVKRFDISDVTKDNRTKLKSDAPKIFKTLFDKKKTREAFQKYEPGEKFVSEQINGALSDTDYTGKINEENYIAPKYTDKKNLRQKIDEKLENAYSDVLKKYLTLHRANLTMTKCAPAIIKQLDKAKVSPTGGIKAIIDEKDGKKSEIMNGLRGKEPFKAAEYFKWMTEKLSDYKNHGLGDAIDGALRNRRQMDHVIEQLIFDAVEEEKDEAAETVMEVMSVMQYGTFTSRTMNAVNETDMTLFSANGLSINNNEYMKGITKAADFMIKKGIQLAGYTTTALANRVFRNKSSVLSNSANLKQAVIDEKKRLANEKSEFEKDKKKQDRADRKTLMQSRLNLKNSRAYFNSLDIKTMKQADKKLKTDRATEEQKKSAFEAAQQDFDVLEQEKQTHERLFNIFYKEKPQIVMNIQDLKAKLKAIPNPAPDQEAEFEAQAIKEEIKLQQERYKQLEEESDTLQAGYSGNIFTPYDTTRYDAAKNNRDAAKKAYDDQKQDNDTLQQNINTYNDSKALIKETKKQMAERQKKADNWDDEHKNRYAKLWAHWEFLQTGKTKSLFHWSTKNLQKKMDAGKMNDRYNAFYANWLKGHSYAA